MPRLAMKFSSSFSLVSMGSRRSSTQQLRAEKGNGADRGGDKASVIGDGGEGMYFMIYFFNSCASVVVDDSYLRLISLRSYSPIS